MRASACIWPRSRVLQNRLPKVGRDPGCQRLQLCFGEHPLRLLVGDQDPQELIDVRPRRRIHTRAIRPQKTPRVKDQAVRSWPVRGGEIDAVHRTEVTKISLAEVDVERCITSREQLFVRRVRASELNRRQARAERTTVKGDCPKSTFDSRHSTNLVLRKVETHNRSRPSNRQLSNV